MNTSRLHHISHPYSESVAAGLMLGLSFPPFDLAVLQFPAFLILFRLLLGAGDWRQAVRFLYPGLLVWNLSATYWLMIATVAGGTAAILANALLMLLPLLAMRRFIQAGSNIWLTALYCGAVWTTYEFAHHNWELAWPWLTLGNAWSNLPGLIQYISFTGHLAVSFWVVSSAVLLWHAIELRERIRFVYALGLVLLFPGLSWLAASEWREQPSGEIDVAVIQPNLDSYQPYGGLSGIDEVIDNLMRLSDSVRTPQTDLIIWPENAIETAIPADNPYNARLIDSLSSWQSELITGAGFMEFYEEIAPPSIARESGGGRRFNIYNSALHYTPRQLTGVYKKRQLVPMVERIPYAETLERIDIFDWVNWGEITGYGRGREANNFQTAGQATPALVCYDSVFPGWVRQFVRNGAGFITIITNDGWWGDTGGHTQHFSYARLRAIELRQWVVRSANNGISGIISPEGNVIMRTGYWTRTAFTHTIRPTNRLSFYARFGDWFNWLLAAVTLHGIWRHRGTRTG